MILKYDDIHKRYVNNVQIISGTFIQGLSNAEPMDTNDVVYPSCYRSPIKNDMSLIRLFRSPGFNVLSLGDCESLEISKRLQQRNLIKTEVDVLILPHHGADNGFMTGDFLDTVNPRVAVCSSNYDNRFEHPDPRIRSLLAAREIPVMTTKRGDVIIYQTATYENAQAINFISGNKDLEKPISFKPKRFSRNQKAA